LIHSFEFRGIFSLKICALNGVEDVSELIERVEVFIFSLEGVLDLLDAAKVFET
jgi:hypothetical protein|tara:strand:+ start:876 stop:1037 length:162 start_codon:yes stop_codon:yes gene_type:complete